MGIIKQLRQPQKRSADYAAAAFSRLTAGMSSYSLSANQEIFRSLRTLRARSRELARDNAHAKKFLQMVETNVIGPDGIILQNKAGDFNKDGSFTLDSIANNIIERSFREWGKRGTCDVTGRLSFPALQRLYVRTMARDGEVLIRRIRDPKRNKYGYALQFIDADRLDERYNDDLPSGNKVRMGIELNIEGRPVAYHILSRHPGDMMAMDAETVYQRERVIASEMIHDFVADRPEQIRGVPWMHAAMLRLSHLGAFDEAAIIAARIGAAKMGFFTSPEGDGSNFADDQESDGTLIGEAEPGTFQVLGKGQDFKAFDPKYPEAAYDGFQKACLRGIASGFGVSYNSLASDLEGVSYSSIRQGVLDERDCWKIIQAVVCDGLMDTVYNDWIEVALLRGAIASGSIVLPATKIQKFRAPTFQPRRWQWVDPSNDINAAKEAVLLGVKSRTQIAAEQGDDIQDVMLELEQEQEMRKELGLDSGPTNTGGAVVQDQALNGAQMASLQGIVQSVTDGLLPSESAIKLVMLGIPTMTEDDAKALVNPAKTFTPKTSPGSAPTAPP